MEIPEDGAEGMIVTQGGRFGGYGFYLLQGKPVFLWNLVDLKRIRWEGPEVLAPGKHTLEFDFTYDGLGLGTLAFNNLSGIGRGGTGVLKVDGDEAARQTMERTLPLILQWDENFDVGADTGTPVDDQDYQVPFRFTGKLDKLTLTIDRPKLSPEDEKRRSETTGMASIFPLILLHDLGDGLVPRHVGCSGEIGADALVEIGRNIDRRILQARHSGCEGALDRARTKSRKASASSAASGMTFRIPCSASLRSMKSMNWRELTRAFNSMRWGSWSSSPSKKSISASVAPFRSKVSRTLSGSDLPRLG